MSEFFVRFPEFAGRHSLMLMIFVFLLLFFLANELGRFFRKYKELTPAALTRLINQQNALLIDMSSLQDYEKGHITGAKHVPMSQFDPENKDLAKVKNLPVALYCKTGQTSSQAAARLVKAGFKHVYFLAGGLTSWLQADLPVVGKPSRG